MTDEFEQRARAAGRRVNDEAAALAGQSGDGPSVLVTSQRSRWLGMAAALLLVAGTASLVLVASNRDAQAPADTASVTGTGPLSNTTISTSDSTTSLADTTTSSAPASPAVPEDLPLVAFEESTCRAQSIEWTQSDEPFRWSPFARGIPEGAPVQVIADPSQGAAGPFAVVLRDYQPSRTAGTGEATEIDGKVFVNVYDALDGSGDIGNGEAVWNLSDGSQGYLRSRGLDRDDIESIVANLRPRPPDHPIPGFDYDTGATQPAQLTLVAEQTTDTLSSSGYSLNCRATNGLDVLVAVIADEGVAPYAIAIDRPRPAWIARADGAVYIGGIEARNAHGSPDPPADALTTISPERWQQLRQQPGVGPRTQTGGDSAPEMSVDGALVVGAEFRVSFTGSLRESRGGYFWLEELDGTQVALLRSDGNPEIPMSYELDVANAGTLDDALSGESSTLLLPPQIEPGQYHLCTANSSTDVCIEVEILGG